VTLRDAPVAANQDAKIRICGSNLAAYWLIRCSRLRVGRRIREFALEEINRSLVRLERCRLIADVTVSQTDGF